MLDAGRLEPEAGKALEDNAGEIVPVADQVSEHADEQRLLGEPRNDVLVRGPAPEYGRQRDVDRGQRCGQERHFAAEQAKAEIDVPGEDLEETVDDAGAAHHRVLTLVEFAPRGRLRSWLFMAAAGAFGTGSAGNCGDFVETKKCRRFSAHSAPTGFEYRGIVGRDRSTAREFVDKRHQLRRCSNGARTAASSPRRLWTIAAATASTTNTTAATRKNC